ncbi:DUF4377 domain-containing protein [Deinococcus sp. KNUC1210]|uniref:DUF4377 domain-containing protein n=1 Tax=Deinococcus sp. KNUC1210 TaxID=2917691 RepID=UPI001EF01CAE|nr:DUF4377 domain-containing protein [Deinococcus sp. KNUC1210]ULH15525.1 DUF4377 domain-containing protein [Deinococcus sp. KNUC1210]
MRRAIALILLFTSCSFKTHVNLREVEIAPNTSSCYISKTCMIIRSVNNAAPGAWSLLPIDQITDFHYEPGFTYDLVIAARCLETGDTVVTYQLQELKARTPGGTPVSVPDDIGGFDGTC